MNGKWAEVHDSKHVFLVLVDRRCLNQQQAKELLEVLHKALATKKPAIVVRVS